MQYHVKRTSFLFSLIVLAALFSYGGYVFLSSVLDPNNYKEEIARQIESAIGKKAYIGAASLSFKNGVGIRLGPVKIAGEGDSGEIFSAESVTTLISVIPLLKKEIQVKSVILNAPIFGIRLGPGNGRPKGSVAAQGLPGQKESIPWQKALPVFGAASHFRAQKGQLKILDEKERETDLLAGPASFDLEIKKGRKGEELYSFDLGVILKYADKKQGIFQLDGGISFVPETLDFQGFGFHAKVVGENIKQEILSLMDERFAASTFPAPGSFDLNASFEGSPSKKMEAKGSVEFSPLPGIYKMDSAGMQPAKLKFAALYKDQSLSLEELRLNSGNLEIQGKINVENINAGDPSLALDLAAQPMKISALRENIYFKNLPEKIKEIIGGHLTDGNISFDSLLFTGPWSLLKEGRWSETPDRLSLRLSLSEAVGLLPGEKGQVAIQEGSGSFLFEKNVLSFENVSFSAMENRVSDLGGRFLFSGTPRLENLSLKSELHLEKLGSLLEKFFPKETTPYLGQLDDLKGTVRSTLNLFPAADGSSLSKYTGEAVFEDASFYHHDLKIPVKEIKGSMKFASHEKAETGDASGQASGAAAEKEGVFLEFKDFSAAASESRLLNLSGNYRCGKGETPALALLLKGVLNLGDAKDPLWPFILEKAGPLQGYKPKGGKTEFDLQIKGRADNFLATGNFRLINASFQSPFAGLSPDGMNGRLKLEGQSVLVEDLRGKLGASEFSLSGKIDKYLGPAPWFDMNVYLKGEGESFKKLISDNGKTEGKFLKNLSITDSFKIKTRLKGTPEKFQADGSMDFSDSLVQFNENFKKQQGKDLRLTYSGMYQKSGIFDVDHYEFSYLENRITGNNSFFDFRGNDYSVNISAEKFSLAALLDLMDYSYNSSVQGAIGANLTVSGSRDRERAPYVKGKIRLDKLGYYFDVLPVPLKEISGSFAVSGEKLDVDSLSIKYKDSEVILSGVYENFQRPRYELRLDSPRFHMDDILPLTPITILWIREFLSESQRFRNTDGKILINVQDGDFKFLRWRDLKGTLAIKNKVFTLTDAVAQLPDGELLGSGHIGFLSDKGMDFLLNLKTLSVPAERIMYILGPGFDDSLKGNFSLISSLGSEGYKWDEIRNSLHGNLVFLVKDGSYAKQNLLKGMKGILGFGGDEDEDKKKIEPREFYRLGGKFEFNNGTAVTNNFAILTKTSKTSMMGKLLLGEKKLDLSIGVAPWAQADKIISKIPLVGSILTGGDEKSLLTAYYEVKGDMADPQVNALPFKSIGKKFEGIFKGILNTPLDIQDLLIPKKGEN